MSFSWSRYMTYSSDDDYTLLIVTNIFVEHVELHHEKTQWKFTTGRMVVANDRFHQLTKISSFPRKWASTLWKSSTRSWRLPMSHTEPSTFQPAALQVSKLFWRSVSNFVQVYTEAPNPASSSTTPSLDNNNYQKNYYIRVMREVSNYLRISLLWQGHILFVMKFYLYQTLVGDWLLHTERGGWRKRNVWSNSLGDLTINYRKGQKNEEELEKLNLREDLVPNPNSDKSIFPLQTPSVCR